MVSGLYHDDAPVCYSCYRSVLTPGERPGTLMFYPSQSICLQVCYFHPGGPICGCKLAASRLKRLDLEEKRNVEKGLLK